VHWVQAAVQTADENASVVSGKVHPAMDVPAPAALRDVNEPACFELLPSAASRFYSVAP
jgi:hypothetical protein